MRIKEKESFAWLEVPMHHWFEMKIKYVIKDKRTNELIGWEGVFGGERFIIFKCERIFRLGHHFDGRKVKKEKYKSTSSEAFITCENKEK